MNWVRRLAVMALVLMGTPLAAPAQQIMTEGIVDCGLWVKARSTNTALALEHNLIGLLNGIALGSAVDFWRADGTKVSREQVYLWMDNYCRSKPLSGVLEGAISLINERTGDALDRNWKHKQRLP